MEKDIRNIDLSKIQSGTGLTESKGFGRPARNEAQILVKNAKSWNYPVILSHLLLFIAVIVVLTIGFRPGNQATSVVNHVSRTEDRTPTVDEVASVNVAATVATTADYLVANNVTELANTVEVKNSLAQSTDADYLSKPQFVDEGQRSGVIKYVAKEGDNVANIASQFEISEQTVKWANDLTDNTIETGRELFIPATDGIVYTVKEGDTPESLADKYQSSATQIISFNDAELGGLQAGQIIVVPGGVLPENEQPGFVETTTPAPVATTTADTSSGFAFGSTPVFGGNGYAYGYCTYYAAAKRAEIGRPIPNNWGNATTWDEGARAMGMRVDQTPEVGAIFQVDGGWMGYGHVGIVEEVRPDGSFVVSEMNAAGWNVISGREFSAGEAAGFDFIH